MNSNHTVRFIHRLAAIVAVASFALVTRAAEPETHNPYTVYGVQLRANLLPQETTSAYSTQVVSQGVGPTLFQEMVPCRFVSTLDPDQYPQRWGGQPFQVNESRVYQPIGYMAEGLFKNPCSERIPPTAVALAVRVGSYKPAGNGSVYLAPGTNQTFSHPALLFKADYDTSEEATVVLHDNTFAVTTADQATELTIDIIGYFIPDTTAGGGAKGDQGERGETGAMGPKGEKGDRGEQGISGAEGSKGEKGDPGVAGAEGAKGEKGDPGVAGAQGEKGDRGEAGVAGAKGEKGDQGDAGVAGAKGEKGDRGDAGVTGAKGEKGDRGDAGVAGAKGEKGDRGDAGATGAKGDRGDRGAQGERGAQGPQGPVGIPGVTMSVGTEMFPPGGNITIYDGNIKANSVILLIYIEVSNGNALGVASQKAGSFVATGSPNKPFKYVIFNMN